MISAWIPITILAAVFQSVRTALQKSLRGQMSAMGSTFTRFAFAWPFGLLYVWFSLHVTGLEMPGLGWDWAGWLAMGSLAQIVATALLVEAMNQRNFALGVAYSKTEPIQVAIFGLVLLGDQFTPLGFAAIIISTLGVLLFSLAGKITTLESWKALLTDKVVSIGVASGAGFAVSAVGYRGATLALGTNEAMVAAAVSVVAANIFQTLVVGIWLKLREPGELGKVARAWKPSLASGITSVAGSVCWFSAFALQPAADVRTLGLIDLVFTVAITVFWFKERIKRVEFLGMALLVAGIVLLLHQHL